MWIHTQKTDRAFILFPHWIGIILLLIFPGYFVGNRDTSLIDWLVLVLCIDVAHVYSTLFRTYFYPEARKLNRRLLVLIPLLAYLAGVLLIQVSGEWFWRILAYLAVFHFIRQQYGFIKIYQRMKAVPAWIVKTDTWLVYLFTIVPVIIWHLEGPKNFVWFTDKDFLFIDLPFLALLFKGILFALFSGMIISFLVQWKKGFFNWPKNLILLATALNWSIGIVVLNGGLSFTLLNVVAHGIPYMALIWIHGHKSHTKSSILSWIFSAKGWIIIIACCILFACIEEGFWDRFIWQDHGSFFGFFSFLRPVAAGWVQSLLIPLLALPQITHYVIDGFIWRKSSAQASWQEPKQ